MFTLCPCCSVGFPHMECYRSPADATWASHRLQFFKYCSSGFLPQGPSFKAAPAWVLTGWTSSLSHASEGALPQHFGPHPLLHCAHVHDCTWRSALRCAHRPAPLWASPGLYRASAPFYNEHLVPSFCTDLHVCSAASLSLVSHFSLPVAVVKSCFSFS